MNQPADSAKKDKLKTIDWLTEHFPAAFFKKARDVKPLKIGKVKKKRLNRFFYYFI